MLKKLWLVFAQAVTILLALLFTFATLRPEWLPQRLVRERPPLSAPAPAPGAIVEPAAGDTPPATGTAAARVTPILSYSEAARRATAAVVNIYTMKTARVPQDHPLLGDPLFRRYFGDQFGDRQQANSLGSGVIVSADGYVLTNHHVVEGADEIEVLLADGSRARARVVGSDPETDLAVLRIDLSDLPAIAFGNADAARVGDVVLAVGNPFGVGQTVTMGIISALGRTQLGINTFENFIQTDAAINPGNSGGALVDAAGRLIGINSTIYSRSGGSMGIGFAIPVSLARDVLAQIIEKGEVTRGWLGVEPQDVDAAAARALALDRAEGVVIVGLQRGGPADRAGIRVRDVVVEVEGRPTHNTPTLLARIAQLPPGSSARVTVLRDGRPVAVDVTVGRRPRAG